MTFMQKIKMSSLKSKVKAANSAVRDGVIEVRDDMTEGEKVALIGGGVCVAQAGVCIPLWGYVAGAAAKGTILAGAAGVLVTIFKVQAVAGAAAMVGGVGKAFVRGAVEGYQHEMRRHAGVENVEYIAPTK